MEQKQYHRPCLVIPWGNIMQKFYTIWPHLVSQYRTHVKYRFQRIYNTAQEIAWKWPKRWSFFFVFVASVYTKNMSVSLIRGKHGDGSWEYHRNRKRGWFLHYMAYPMVKMWNKSSTVGHVWLFLGEILCKSFIQYGPILYPNTELVRNKRF